VAASILSTAQLTQNRRCPGSMERSRDASSPVKTATCDPTQVPLGP
jgi:hypothetical protein